MLASIGLLSFAVADRSPRSPDEVIQQSMNNAADDSSSEEAWYRGERAKALQGDFVAMGAVADMYSTTGRWHHDDVLACAWTMLIVDRQGASARPAELQRRSTACARLEAPGRAMATQRASEFAKIVAIAR
ncbi:MAG TPA: hypothetical protein VHV78_17655 [Gemmatimonadaceae bacterium]|nr:hypothetical protein [Gemmatimonadaceae bacterium]